METRSPHSWCRRRAVSSLVLATAVLAVALLGADVLVALGQPAPLSTVPVPTRAGGDIVDQAAAVRLGKALYWDTQVGGDGHIACATCHFHAGTDNRTFNSLHPGPDGSFATDGVNGPGQLLTLTNILNDDRVGSQGIVGSLFVGVNTDPTVAADDCNPDTAVTPFFTALASHRRVTGRQAPPTIGAVFNRQNFWDGRANDNFNGVNPFGLTVNAGAATLGTTVSNSSLASQAVGPPNNETEMSCKGRAFNGATGSLGAKLLARPALQHQLVNSADSVLGTLSASPANGLNCGGHPCSYTELISAAFGPAMAADAANQFSRIWGQAVQAYVSTLIPGRTPMDLFLAGNRTALTAQQQRGLNLFSGKGCTRCHAGAELTDASVSFAARRGLINEDGGDQGFHNIGVRPTDEDLGRAGSGPTGSFSQSGATADRGAFKTPQLRNVGLTAPYFHNGGKATIADVIDFYNRGGDFANAEKARRIRPLGLKPAEAAQLVDFLTNGLTDCRVANDEAPFDHPSLTIPNGRFDPILGQGVDVVLPATGGVGTCP